MEEVEAARSEPLPGTLIAMHWLLYEITAVKSTESSKKEQSKSTESQKKEQRKSKESIPREKTNSEAEKEQE